MHERGIGVSLASMDDRRAVPGKSGGSWLRAIAGTVILVIVLAGCGGQPVAGTSGTPEMQETSVVRARETATPFPDTSASFLTATPETPATSTSVAQVALEVPLQQTPSPVPTLEATFPPDVTDDVSAYDTTELKAGIDARLDGIDGTAAIVIAAIDGTILYEHNGDESMEAASLYKLAIMVEIFRQFELGALGPDTPVLVQSNYFGEGADSIGYAAMDGWIDIESLLFAMIAQSSNVAAYALLDLVGNDNVNETMASFGLDGIEVRWSPSHLPPVETFPVVPDIVEEIIEEVFEDGETVVESDKPEVPDEPNDDPSHNEDGDDDEPAGNALPLARWMALSGLEIVPTLRAEEAYNVVTANSLAELLAMIVRGEVVSETASAAMLGLLTIQQIPGGLSSGLPDGVVAHKTGYLEDGVVNDAGIVTTPAGPFVAVVLTENVPEDIAYWLMAEAGKLLYELGAR